MTTVEVVTRELTVIEIGREYPFFFDRTPNTVPPIEAKDPEEVRVWKDVIIDDREALIYTGICKINRNATVTYPFVVINFKEPSEEDRKCKAKIKMGGHEYTSMQHVHKAFYIAESENSPVFIAWENENGKILSFKTPIEAEALISAMTLKLEKLST